MDAAGANGFDAAAICGALSRRALLRAAAVEGSLRRANSGRRRAPSGSLAVAEAGAPAGRGGDAGDGDRGGYGGPLVKRQRDGMRPDVAAAFDRMSAAARGAGLPSWSSPASAPTPNRRRSSPPIPTRSGSRRRATRCTAARPSSTSARNPPTAGWRPTRGVRLPAALLLGGLALRLRGGPPAPCSAAGERLGARAGWAGRSPLGGDAPGFVPAEFARRSPRRRPLERLGGAARRHSRWPSRASARIAGSPAGAQGIAQFMPGTAVLLRPRQPLRPRRRDRRRRPT